jgi:hypothetical protein
MNRAGCGKQADELLATFAAKDATFLSASGLLRCPQLGWSIAF